MGLDEEGTVATHYDHKESEIAPTGDIALDVFSKGEALDDAIDPAAERRVVRKIDMMVIPFICVTYLVTYIDKATLGYAAVFGLQTDLNLHGTQYSWLSKSFYVAGLSLRRSLMLCLLSNDFLYYAVGSIFYFGYLVFEYPTSHAMQKLSIAKWLGANIFIWGGFTMALGGCKSFSSFAGLRFVQGALESCSTPAYLLITASWYTVAEQPVRIGWWSTFLGLANAFGGLLGYGIGHIQGALASWRYQFIIIGAASSIWGAAVFFFLADNATVAYVLL